MIAGFNNTMKFFKNNSRLISLLIEKHKLAPALMGLSMASGLVSAGGSVYSVSQGQAEGGVGDFFKGFVDLSRDDYRADGGDQAGSTSATAGKTAQNLMLGIFSTIVGCGKLKITKPVKSALQKGILGLMAWQSLTVGDELVRPDHTSNVVDIADTVGGALSVLSLNSTLSTVRKLKPIVKLRV
jgi:hypothetical protein